MTMIVVLVVLAVVVLAAAALAWRRRRASHRARSAREDELREQLQAGRTPAPAGLTTDGSTSPDLRAPRVMGSEPVGSPDDGADDDDGDVLTPAAAARPDPAEPPAAILMEVTGTHPWAPARVFLTELKAIGYDTTVELPDLVVMRDDQRLPVTVREPAGPPGRLVVTTPPPLLSSTLEHLVRSLIESDFSLDLTEGREVRLADDDGAVILLTVSELATAA
ncbi:MAG: hypothetical protein AAGK32_00780 [Actinomycetota bacterium]